MKTILRYQVAVSNDDEVIQVHQGAMPLHVDRHPRGLVYYIWMESDTDKPIEERRFRLVQDKQDYTRGDTKILRYVGTFLDWFDARALHAYEVLN